MTKDAENPKKVRVRVKASPKAMKHWAMQYIDHVEITYPESLRKSIQKSLNEAIKKYWIKKQQNRRFLCDSAAFFIVYR